MQASIEYTRYLEQCIVDLKANSHAGFTPVLAQYAPSARISDRSSQAYEDGGEGHGDDDEDEEEDEDEDMEDAMDSAPSTARLQPAGAISTPSPSHSPTYHGQRHYSFSSQSAATSPGFGPHHAHAFSSRSALSSPHLRPQARDSREVDHEATEALLLLNTDRRSKCARGMSVKDLLSA